MATEIIIPDFQFASFYYPELLEALIQYKRQNVPEHTDESAYDGFMQFLRMQALVGHLNNTLIDLVANESTLPTSKLVETVRNMLQLIDYRMATASPSQVDLIYELAKVFAATAKVIPSAAQAATKRQEGVPVLYFEALEELSVERTDQFSYVLAEEDGVFTDFTAKANSQTSPGDDWTPWSSPAIKDAIYFAHKQAMWDELGLFLATAAVGLQGVWEYYDGDFIKAAPSSVTNLGPSLEFDLTSYLGIYNRAGTKIRAQLNETGAYEEVFSTWNGSKNIATTGLLGQSTPSTTASDYTVGSDWQELPQVEDESQDLTQDGSVTFALPQTLTHDWKEGSVDGKPARWLRYRIVSVAAPSSPVMKYARMDEGKQYVMRLATQGRSVEDSPLGSSTGLPNQEFQSTRDFFIWGSEQLTIDGEVWARVDNFLGSTSQAKVYVVKLGKNDRATFAFGDGSTGRIPPIGVANIAVSYRVVVDNSVDGNVGANTVTSDKSGLSYVNKLWNPRPATGWAEAEGASDESLERAKIAGPNSLRVKEVALSPDDLLELTTRYTDENGSSVFSRARYFEESFGPKTVEVTVVANGGGIASADQLQALEDYFNGNQFAYPPIEKHFVANQEVVAINYTPKPINITAVVYGDVEQQAIINRLAQVIQPEALKPDGVTWEWSFGGEVRPDRIIHEIYETDESITRVDLTLPSGPVSLQPRELPVLGAVNITVIEP